MADISRNPQLDDAYQNALVQFSHLPSVTAIDIGYKYIAGEKTENLTIRIHFKKKRPKAEIQEAEILPETF